jgi:hypothetical protein
MKLTNILTSGVIDLSNDTDNFLQAILLSSFFVKNETTSFKLQTIFDEMGNLDGSKIVINQIKPIVSQILTDVSDIHFIDGIYTYHHDVNTQINPISLNDCLYDLHYIKNKIDIIKIKISYYYFLGHEIGHIVMSKIFDLYRNQFIVEGTETYSKSNEDINLEFNNIFDFKNIFLNPKINTTDASFVKFHHTQINNINVRDVATAPSSVSEALADYFGYVVVENFIENDAFVNKYLKFEHDKKKILEYLYSSICDTYTAQGHADAFVRTNFFVFSNKLSDMILTGGNFNNTDDKYYQKYLKYKAKYLKLKNNL